MARSKKSTVNYWISYSDLMAGLLFVLLAIIIISTYQTKQKIQVIEDKNRVIESNIQLREIIANKLITEFRNNNIENVVVDKKTGDIQFLETNEWFNNNDDRLLPRAKKTLNLIMPIYLSILFDEGITKNKLDRILIEGHASQEWDRWERYLHDMDLSERRALSVGKFTIKSFPEYYQKLKKHLVTLGRSFADAKYKGVNNPNRSMDRRVVIKYQLQYEEMMRELTLISKNTKTNAN